MVCVVNINLLKALLIRRQDYVFSQINSRHFAQMIVAFCHTSLTTVMLEVSHKSGLKVVCEMEYSMSVNQTL